MAITLNTATRNAACDAIVDLVDGGTGAGTIEIKSADNETQGGNELAIITFQDPAFGAAANGVATAATPMTDETSANAGTASHYVVYDSAGTYIWKGTVSTSGADLNLSSVSIGAGDTVSITSFTLTVPAS